MAENVAGQRDLEDRAGEKPPGDLRYHDLL